MAGTGFDGEAQALWYEAPGRASLRAQPLAPLGREQARVAMQWSALSRGTERLVFSGHVPASEYQRMRAPLQDGDFPFPVKYGYCATGRVEKGPDHLVGRTVFCLHPHQDRANVPVSWLVPVPADVPPRRAVLAANMETALNGVWDSGAGPGDRIVIVGAGLVGLLVGCLMGRMPGAEVTLVDIDSRRADLARTFGLRFAEPDALPPQARDADVVVHASATPAGLATALDCAGFEALVLEMSWYGRGDVPAALGGAFHSRRLTLRSSQVGQVSPGRRPRWPHARRLAKALDLLRDDRLDDLITEEVDFSDLPAALPRILSPGATGLVTAVRYPAA